MPHKPFPKCAISPKENQYLALTVSLITETSKCGCVFSVMCPKDGLH